MILGKHVIAKNTETGAGTSSEIEKELQEL